MRSASSFSGKYLHRGFSWPTNIGPRARSNGTGQTPFVELPRPLRPRVNAAEIIHNPLWNKVRQAYRASSKATVCTAHVFACESGVPVLCVRVSSGRLCMF